MLTSSGFLGVERALEKRRVAGWARVSLPEGSSRSLALREGSGATRSLDTEGIHPAGGLTRCTHLALCGQRRIAGATCAHRQCR